MKKTISIIALFLLAACARDRDADSHRRGKLQEDLAKLQAIAGVYSGQLLSNSNGESLGTAGLMLEADTLINELNEEIPILSGALSFKASSNVKIVFTKSTFNSETNVFKLTSTIKFPDNEKIYNLNFNGVLVGDVIQATFESFGFSELGANIKLERMVSTQAFEETFSIPTNPEALPYGTIQKIYRGKTSRGTEATLSLKNDGFTVEDRFLQSFLPERSLVATLGLSPTLRIAFSNTRLQVKTGAVSATKIQQSSAEPITISLNCSKKGMRGTKEILKCTYTASGNSGQVITVEMDELVESEK
jgi:hypothetical protein